jgi:hypothetical protein
VLVGENYCSRCGAALDGLGDDDDQEGDEGGLAEAVVEALGEARDDGTVILAYWLGLPAWVLLAPDGLVLYGLGAAAASIFVILWAAPTADEIVAD